MEKIIQYKHHDTVVSVREELKGTHSKVCLCYICKKFKPGEKDNCRKANRLYQLCVEEDMVTPVFECRADCFELKENV